MVVRTACWEWLSLLWRGRGGPVGRRSAGVAGTKVDKSGPPPACHKEKEAEEEGGGHKA